MNIQWKNLITCLAIPLAVGSLASLLTPDAAEVFATLQKPALAPPGWLFPIVWTLLYLLMGIASYLVLTSGKPNAEALKVYGLQLLFNFFWPILFFNLQFYLLAFFWLLLLWLLLLWLLVLKTTLLFYQITKPAGYLMLPYLLWVTFAACLNLSLYLLN